MLVFMPWCPIDKDYAIGDVAILPFERHNPIEGLDDAAQCRINEIMATYKDIDSKPVHKAAIICYGSKSPIDDLTDDEVEIAQDLAVLACFSCLAKREYFNPLGPYCNSDCFSLYIQKFDKADFTALTVRRREGRTLSGWPIDDIWITVPVHCHTIREVSLDADLLKALVDHRAELSDGEWGRWQNAISCFNQANSDSDRAQIDVFERFADTTNFLKPPPGQKSSLDWHWKRLVGERISDIGFKQAFDHAWNCLTPEQRGCLERKPNGENK